MDDILIDRHDKKWKWEQISQQCFAGRKSANACRKRHSKVLHERSEPARWNEDKTAHPRALNKVDPIPVDSTKARRSRHVQKGLLTCRTSKL
jgi:Cft2 family RNA processing exonuclease